MKKPVIGLVPLYDDEKQSYWMLPGYMQVLEKCGAVPLMLPLTDDPEELQTCLALCDGILLTGGHDVDPALYGEMPLPQCGIPCPARDRMEKKLLASALERNKPIFGICRGIQFLNAALGGTLYQDLEVQHPSRVEHHMTPPYDRAVHTVTVLPDTPLARIVGPGILGVNSYHHQAVRKLAPTLQPMAVSSDGLVEAVCRPDKRFVMAVQWHPEFNFQTSPQSLALMQAFVDACAA